MTSAERSSAESDARRLETLSMLSHKEAQEAQNVLSTSGAELLGGTLEQLSNALLILGCQDALREDERQLAYRRRFKEAAQR
jgi:hypothetical protein